MGIWRDELGGFCKSRAGAPSLCRTAPLVRSVIEAAFLSADCPSVSGRAVLSDAGPERRGPLPGGRAGPEGRGPPPGSDDKNGGGDRLAALNSDVSNNGLRVRS